MIRTRLAIIPLILSFAFIAFGYRPHFVLAEESIEQTSQEENLQQRIDFGNSYILGQSIKSGAVYLLHRKQSEIKSMLQLRENYRAEILEGYNFEGLDVAMQASELKITHLSD